MTEVGRNRPRCGRFGTNVDRAWPKAWSSPGQLWPIRATYLSNRPETGSNQAKISRTELRPNPDSTTVATASQICPNQSSRTWSSQAKVGGFGKAVAESSRSLQPNMRWSGVQIWSNQSLTWPTRPKTVRIKPGMCQFEFNLAAPSTLRPTHGRTMSNRPRVRSERSSRPQPRVDGKTYTRAAERAARDYPSGGGREAGAEASRWLTSAGPALVRGGPFPRR